MPIDDDITTGAAFTAIGAAAMRALESHRPDAVCTDPYAEILVRATGVAQWIEVLDGRYGGSTAEFARLREVMGGFMITRTRYCDDVIGRALAEGVRQLAILGAGLDARAWRLELPTGTTVFEIDQPKVLRFKATALADHPLVATRREVPVDLRENWPKALSDNGFEPTRPTVWIAEGLLPYLPADAVLALFENIAAHSAPGSRFAANFNAAPLTGEQLAKLREDAARRYREMGARGDVENMWHFDEIQADAVSWFTAHGWSVTTTDTARLLTELGRPVPAEARATMRAQGLLTAAVPTPPPINTPSAG
ncbi:SAM-dependent methyltransferase [Nocardia sp. CDC159]|uniref:S-adenosyl-L-methionine-dependent methyltransferase n=1 Tax=Nocardia pulmonis TaxID=2951408 RepID=A0A9X2IUY7_9NOCA|nr:MULTISPECIES: SAM-dependent methyltransferase [Nocardia]MCM6772658.1 SAM-dependent methyltransferase [Nocardia pulmonis]MCM6786039.1 SAM-dependent methyltransferase [Nocardia sp. CDC159]